MHVNSQSHTVIHEHHSRCVYYILYNTYYIPHNPCIHPCDIHFQKIIDSVMLSEDFLLLIYLPINYPSARISTCP